MSDNRTQHHRAETPEDDGSTIRWLDLRSPVAERAADVDVESTHGSIEDVHVDSREASPNAVCRPRDECVRSNNEVVDYDTDIRPERGHGERSPSSDEDEDTDCFVDAEEQVHLWL